MMKRKVALIAKYSTWGGVSNFNEMFNQSGKYEAYEILNTNSTAHSYGFGERMNENKWVYGVKCPPCNKKLEEFVTDPDTIFFLVDVSGIRLFTKLAEEMDITSKNINVFWTSDIYIKGHKEWNAWAEENNVTIYAQLSLLEYSAKNAHPLMQPYNIHGKYKKQRHSEFPGPSKETFVICHSPGVKGRGNDKGTQDIQRVMLELREKHEEFSYSHIGEFQQSAGWTAVDRLAPTELEINKETVSLSHEDCLKVKANADVFVDQIGLHTVGGFGKSGIESLCMGIPTVCSLHHTQFVGPYVDLEHCIASVRNEEELYDCLLHFYEDKEHFNKIKEMTKRSSVCFSYKNTLKYLEGTMAQ